MFCKPGSRLPAVRALVYVTFLPASSAPRLSLCLGPPKRLFLRGQPTVTDNERIKADAVPSYDIGPTAATPLLIRSELRMIRWRKLRTREAIDASRAY